MLVVNLMFLNGNNLLYQFMSGFRGKYSTDTRLIHLMDSIKGNTAKGLYTGIDRLDLQKAFDTVDHDIQCKKMEEIGIVSVGWFRSYLSDRQQVVTVDGTTSSPGIVYLGPCCFCVTSMTWPPVLRQIAS